MKRAFFSRSCGPWAAGLLAVALLVLPGCASSGFLEFPGPQQQLEAEVRAVLGIPFDSPDYQTERARLVAMGPEIDPILVEISLDRRTRLNARTEALLLLADRRSLSALPTLRTALQNANERIRSAAVFGLQRLLPESVPALELIRFAAEDPSRNVRLSAIQSLDIREVETIRMVLERETDNEVRQVAFQLVALAEARGAALKRDERGALRTATSPGEPQIVFRPTRTDSAADVSVGDLRIELPAGLDIPITSTATVVRNVVPAFFSPDRSMVVAESDGQIRVFHIASRSVRSVGQGMAPRLIPFSNEFVFLREQSSTNDRVTQVRTITYELHQGSFVDPTVEPIGPLVAVAQASVNGGASPVTWMVVRDAGEGFVLSGTSFAPFPLPRPAPSPGRRGMEQ
jgi:hypothetical protein